MELNHHLRAHVRAFAVGRIFVLRNSSRRSAVELLPVLPGRYCRPQFMYVRNRELTGIQLHRFCSELRNWKAVLTWCGYRN